MTTLSKKIIYRKKIALIVAVGECGTIGNKGEMPWHLPADLKWFVKQTNYRSIIMGRRTYESIGKPLPNRKNIVLTRDKHFPPLDKIDIRYSLEEALILADSFPSDPRLSDPSQDRIFIIGGANLFHQVYDYLSEYYLTIIHATFDGDTKLEAPILSPQLTNDWDITYQNTHPANEQNPYDMTFYKLKRK